MNLLIFFKTILATWGSLYFQINFKIGLFIYAKNAVGILKGNALNLRSVSILIIYAFQFMGII